MKKMNILEYYDYFIAQQKRLIGKGRTKETIKTYHSRAQNFKDYLHHVRKETYMPKEINIRLIRDFEIYLKGEKGHCHDYAMKSIQMLNRMLKYSLENGDIKYNPVDLYTFSYERTQRTDFLELEELEKLKSFDFGNAYQERTRDLFMFCCYTGLAYIDLKNFNAKINIIKGPDGKPWINFDRTKTKTEVHVPLLKQAKEVLEKYNYTLPVSANKCMNKVLKRIASKVGIKKNICTHTGRKTFGNVLHNELNVPLETVSRMMGHKSVKTTESWYVRTNVKKIMNDMKGVAFFQEVA